MYKKIFQVLFLGFLLAACSQPANGPVLETATQAVSIAETATPRPPTSTPPPTATITATPAPDFSLVGLPAEEDGERVFDFVEQMCNAEWSTRGEELPCPGGETEATAGYVMQLDAETQGMPSSINVLLTYAPQAQDVTITGKYPSFTVQKGDRFRAVLACREHSFCDVDFLLSFFNEKGRRSGLTHWKYIFADDALIIDYSLDGIAGETVQFELAVSAHGNLSDGFAVWIAPHIYRPAP